MEKRCRHNNENNICANGFYPHRQTPMICRGIGNCIPDCMKDILPKIHNGHGKPIQVKQPVSTK
jgi:hypothetical protein